MLAARIALLREWLEAGQTAWIHVAGDSMWPLLPRGSRVQVGGVAGEIPTRGSLVVYEIEDRLVCHRLLGHRRGRLLARGDAWRAVTAWLPESAVVGVVIALDRRGRVVALRTRRRRCLAVALAVASLVVARVVGAARWLKRSRAGASRWAPAA